MYKTLSIIVPTYNMEKYLEKCLNSLIIRNAKLLEALEVLIIIDGATDRSSEIAHSYQSRYPNVFRVIDKENGNYGSCINKGLEIAKGIYVKVLDADDSFDTINFEDFLQFISRQDVDMIISPFYIVDESGKVTKHEYYDLPNNELLTWKQLTPAFKSKALQMHAVAYKRQNLININYHQTEGISYTDQEWIFSPLITVNTAIAYPKPIYRYLIGRQGQTVNPQIIKRNISHNEKCCRRIIIDYKSFSSFELYKQQYIDYKFMVTITAMYNWYLLLYTDLNITQLIDFDDFVKSIDDSYLDLLDEQVIKHTHYHYIRNWHNNRAKRNLITKILFVYSKLANRILSKF